MESRPNEHPRLLHEFPAFIFLTGHDFYFFQSAIFVEGYGGMKEQVVITDGIHTAMLKHQPDMLMQLFADTERVVEFSHQRLLFKGECARMFWVYRWEMTTA